jgi:hypothetical protein
VRLQSSELGDTPGGSKQARLVEYSDAGNLETVLGKGATMGAETLFTG